MGGVSQARADEINCLVTTARVRVSFGISNGWPQSDVGWFTGSIYFRVPEDSVCLPSGELTKSYGKIHHF